MGLAKEASNRRKIAFALSIAMLLGTILTFQLPTAQAAHPPGSCLDVEPETDTNPVGTQHTLTATLLAGGPPGSPAGCSSDAPTVPAAGDATVLFDVETGPAGTVIDDDGTTHPRPYNPVVTNPRASDMSCVIEMGESSCTVVFTSPRGGTNLVRGWISDSTVDPDEPRDESSELTSDSGPGDEPDATDVVEKTWQADASRLDCEPDTDSNPAGDPHTITCTARDSFGEPVPNEKVDAEATGANDPDSANGGNPDFGCTTNAQGQCSFTHGPGGTGSTNDLGTTTYRAWIDEDANENNLNEGDIDEPQNESFDNDEPDETDTVTKTWVLSPFECNPETDVNPSGTNHTVTCTARNNSGVARVGVFVDVEATGANDPDGDTPATPDFTCTTTSDDPNTTNANEAGTCSFTHGPAGTPPRSTNSAGTTTYRAWIDADGNHSGGSPSHGAFEGDAAEGPDETAQPGATQEGDTTDVVQKTWTASNVDCNPETDRNPTGTAHSIQCAATDEANNPTPGTMIRVEAAGANDPDGSESFETPDWTCTTGATTGTSTPASFCTIVHGPGGTGRTENSGTTIYTAWVDVDQNAATIEADQNEGRIEDVDLTEPDGTDVVEKTWIASRLDCIPEADTNPAQTAHTVTCSTSDAGSFPSAGINIDVEATGPNDPDNANSPAVPDFSCTTGANGQCSFTHGPGGSGSTNSFGRTLYRAWIDGDNNNATTEADPTEGRDEGTTTTGSPTPTPTPTTTPTSAAAAGAKSADSARVIAQQTTTPTPTPTPTPTSGGGSQTPTPTPSGTPAPTGPGTRAEPDDTDVVEKNWSAVPTRLDISPPTDTAPVGSCNTFTITATDNAGAPVANVVVDIEQRHERSDNVTVNDEPNVSFCTPSENDGTNPSSVDTTRGDLGDGRDGATGGEADRATDSQGKVTIGIRVAPGQGSTGTGNVLVTAFYENEDNDDPDTGDPQDSATKTWTPSQARTIDCTPETASNRLGTEHVVTCTVRDTNAQPAQGEGVTFSEDGPGQFTSSTEDTTDAQGQVTATVTSDEPGTQTITGTLTSSTQGEPDTDECDRAANDPADAPAGVCSDSVEKRWTRGAAVQRGPCKNFFEDTSTRRSGGGRVIVGTSGNDELVGSGGDDIICGLGGNDIIRGRGGSDVLVGNGGRDRIQGGSGRDRMTGGGGSDRLRGGGGRDVLNGSRGTDVLRGGAGDDRLIGNGDDDELLGGAGSDDLDGGGGNDRLNGGDGRDSCAGGKGRDVLRQCE